MALLVTDQGEIDSLRTLLSSTHSIPRNLVLKLYTAPNIAPKEEDAPSQTKYYEPYNANNSLGYGAEPTTGYPAVINNRTEEDQDFSSQYGILLNGNRWTIKTELNAVVTHDGSGTSGTYQLAVDSTDKVKKGDYVTSASGIPDNTYVVDIDGLNLEISQKLTANITSSADNVSFGKGRTTATYPEQIFNFSGQAGDVYGYYLSRANNMPFTLQGVANGLSVTEIGTAILKDNCKGVIGNNYIELKSNDIAGGAVSAGAQNGFQITITTNAGDVKKGQLVTTDATPDRIPAETRVVGVTGNVVTLDKPVTGGNASGNATFRENVWEDLTVGQKVTSTAANTGPDAFPANTTIEGIDTAKLTNDQGPRVYLSNQLTDNIGTASSNAKVDFKHALITSDPSGTAVAHNLNPGDVIYIDNGASGGLTPAHYTVHTVPSNSTFTTTPAMQTATAGTKDGTAYSSIFFAEQFTNGPYSIQNPGDQIKVTLNVSLD